jgi:homoaconitase/3-isopropylmalate dehydratase large subunit
LCRLGEVKKVAESEGLQRNIHRTRDFNGARRVVSMCLAMNPDKLNGREISASSSNRNFIGGRGAPGTHLANESGDGGGGSTQWQKSSMYVSMNNEEA